jgi:hypothetical protein
MVMHVCLFLLEIFFIDLKIWSPNWKMMNNQGLEEGKLGSISNPFRIYSDFLGSKINFLLDLDQCKIG